MKAFLKTAGALFAASASAFAAPATSLTVGEGFLDPLGFYDAAPTFSWKLPPSVKKQTAYRIESQVDGKTWDSGWIESEQSTFVPYGGKHFASRQQVEWHVNFRDENGKESGWSEWAHFELGLLSASDWTAQWIRPAGETDLSIEPVGCLQRSFSIAKKVTRARLYVTARGLFEVSINGTRIGNDHFANGLTPYDKRIDTLTYDVTRQLHVGNNTIEGLIGTGWYAGRLPFGAKKRGPYGENAALLVQMEIACEDASTQTIVSDGNWQGTFNGPIISSSIYDGEAYDARRQPAHWEPVIEQADLGTAALTPKPFAPVRQANVLAVKEITQPQPGRAIFDLGQNMVGWARLKIPVEKDQTITVRFAEMLKNDGTLYTENYRSAKSIDTYTATQTDVIEWEPHFTFHGFRYVELSGLPPGSKPQKGWVTGVVLHSDIPAIGNFSSSNAKLNQLQSNITWGWRGNSLDIPTDCPQRDERMGWTGDAQVFCSTAMFLTNSHAFWKSWLRSMRLDQDANGGIPDIIPNMHAKFRSGSPGWIDAATIIPWDVYVRTADTGLLAENFDMMEKLVGRYRSESVNGLLPKTKGHGDWLQPYPKAVATKADKMGDRRGDTPLPLLGVAFYAHSAQILADSARVLGRKEEAKRYADEAATVRAAFVKEYFDANGKLQNTPETQTAYVLAIAFDLLPAEMKARAGENLVRLVHEADTHLRTGFLGTPFLATALDRIGHADLAAELLFQETYPSWFYPINQGATTMWERWNSYTLDKGFGDVSMNSFNHYAYGAIGQWMQERVAGLAPDPAQPGYKHFFVRPLVVKQLGSARAELDTPYGKAVSAWTKRNGKVEMEVTVPPNTTATIEFADGRKPQAVSAGAYHFETRQTFK
ncbi:MAG: family 78 glycoside hydrolase catalytic domain [Chthoniobacteraceae bacterium]